MPEHHSWPSPGVTLGYCTNVHPGNGLEEVKRSLSEHAAGVRRLVCSDLPLPIGLWLSRRTVRELLGEAGGVESFRRFLEERGLAPFTFNAFPVGDFHGPVVKHAVYTPDWADPERPEYTLAVAGIAHKLLPPGEEISISTLPLGWRGGGDGGWHEGVDQRVCADALRSVAARLADLEQSSGRCIHIDIEPEPGCVLETAAGVVRLYSEHLLRSSADHYLLRYLRVCHDVCHAAVMFEDQVDALSAYARAGIRVGKVQISAAIEADFDAMEVSDRKTAAAELAEFVEPKYLHQTTILFSDGAKRSYHDLPEALASQMGSLQGRWRVHFHVPVHLNRIGLLRSTSVQITSAISAAQTLHDTRHFEIETYAWSVLPQAVRRPSLAEDIAAEIGYVRSLRLPTGVA